MHELLYVCDMKGKGAHSLVLHKSLYELTCN